MNRPTDFIPFARPCLGRAEEEAVLRVMRSGWLTTGAEAKAFEAEFAAAVGSPQALAVNSATAGLHLALEAFGVGAGDTVVTSPYTFAATAETARYLGAEIAFADIEERSFNLDPQALEATMEACRSRGRAVKAVVPVHIGGLPCDMARIMEICRFHGASVVEDAAHAFPSRTPLGAAGTIGEAGVFSFYTTKTITTGEGGMIVTSRTDLAKRMSLMRLHGIDREVWNRYNSPAASWRYAVIEAGYKYNMTDLAAAMGRVQLGRAAEFLERRTAVARAYSTAFGGRGYLRLPPDGPGNAWHLYLLCLEPQMLSIGRDEFIERLFSAGVGVSVHFIPLHIMPYYADRLGLRAQEYPRSLARYERVVSLPIYPDLSDEQVERIIDAVLNIGDSCYKKSAV